MDNIFPKDLFEREKKKGSLHKRSSVTFSFFTFSPYTSFLLISSIPTTATTHECDSHRSKKTWHRTGRKH
ncbi:hypothetical protein GYH30_004241 [Glycine max]|uniref:Uncharacterized protein n=1 Tax=Glycine max TaxID=3847 RepID=K7K8Z8_SOYBN|nr:hypothetical protein GYH30_004241 [Glycine max]